MEPPWKRDPDSEETEIVDDIDVEMIEEEPSDRDTIPPEGLITTNSIPPGDPSIDDALLEEEIDDVFQRVRAPSLPPVLPLTEDELEAEREAEFEALLERSKKPD